MNYSMILPSDMRGMSAQEGDRKYVCLLSYSILTCRIKHHSVSSSLDSWTVYSSLSTVKVKRLLQQFYL